MDQISLDHSNPATTVVTFGLRGMWFQIANTTAVGIILLMFYQDRQVAYRVAIEDRQMFREELREQRMVLDKLSQAVDRMSEEIRNKK